jgi:hypothetical protein
MSYALLLDMERKDTKKTIIIRNQASRAGQSAIVP